MSFQTVRKAQLAIWEPMKESLRLHRASRAARLRGEPISAMEERDARRSWDRVVSDEAVWKLAKLDLLASPEQAAVVQAARAWAKYYGDDFRDFNDMDPEERVLYDAVQALATSPSEVPAEERLTPLVSSPYGSPITPN